LIKSDSKDMSQKMSEQYNFL